MGTTTTSAAAARRLPIRLPHHGAAHRGLQAAGLLVLALLIWQISGASNFRLGQVTSVCIFAIAISGLNLATGFTGMLSIGHSAFYGLGAYVTGILVVDHGWDPLLTIPVAVVISFVVGVLVGLPALRIRGLYLALVTLAVAVAFPELVRHFKDLTGGSSGLVIRARLLTPPEWTGLSVGQRNTWLFWVSLVLLVLTLIVVRQFTRSRWGLAMVAVRDNEVAAASSGVNLAVVKTVVFGISGAITGMGGSMIALYLGALSPDGSFTLLKSIELITGLIVGGVATVGGPVVGAMAVVFLPYLTAQFSSGQMSAVIFGVVLIFIVFVMPHGVVGTLQRAARRVVVVDPDLPSGTARVQTRAVAVPTPQPITVGQPGDAA